MADFRYILYSEFSVLVLFDLTVYQTIASAANGK